MLKSNRDGNTVFYMLCYHKMCYVSFLLEGICIDKLSCPVSLVGTGGKNGIIGEVWNGYGKK